MTGDNLGGHEQLETLFDHPGQPIRKGVRGYLASIAGVYGPNGYPVWALAPIDRYIREGQGEHADMVWLLVDGRPTWALVDTETHAVLELDPFPKDGRIRDQLAQYLSAACEPWKSR